MFPDESCRGDRHIVQRMRRSLYYGKVKNENEVMECPSLPLTQAAVDAFEQALRQSHGRSRRSAASPASQLDLQYASDVSHKACISPCSVVLAIVYLERLRKRRPQYLRSTPPCQLFLVSMLVASKWMYDDGEDEEVLNSEWAASGSLPLHQLNRLELQFLVAMDWNLHVDPDLFFQKLAVIEHLVTWQQTQGRTGAAGYTYNELLSLDCCLQWRHLAAAFPNVCRVMALTLLTYSVLLVALLSASVLTSVLMQPDHNPAAGPHPVIAAGHLNYSTAACCSPPSPLLTRVRNAGPAEAAIALPHDPLTLFLGLSGQGAVRQLGSVLCPLRAVLLSAVIPERDRRQSAVPQPHVYCVNRRTARH